MSKYLEERKVNEFHYADTTKLGIERLLQNNGEYLIVTNRSDQKKRNRYFYEGYFEGYKRKLVFSIEQARNGQIWNPDKPDEFGFKAGTYNVNKYIYNIWKNMERRCYYVDYPAYSHYSAKGVTVSDEFKNYSFFENWYKLQWDGKTKLELDKDVKSDGECKIYSPSTCILIPDAINTFISTLGERKAIEEIDRGRSITYCLRYRRKYKTLYKNFKTLSEAQTYKKALDKQYLEILFSIYPLSEDIKNSLRNYVEISVC